jgi:hypothetical protein
MSEFQVKMLKEGLLATDTHMSFTKTEMAIIIQSTKLLWKEKLEGLLPQIVIYLNLQLWGTS